MALIAVAIIAVATLGIALSKGSAPAAYTPSVGGVTNYDELDATALKIGGSSGSRVGPIIASTCTLIAPSFTVAASTTVPMDCAITGIVTGDLVFAQFGTSTSITGNGWAVDQVSASSTSGYATIWVTNNTGASGLIPAAVASSTEYLVLHPRSTVPGL